MPLMSEADAKAAVSAADQAFRQWRVTTAKERAALLRRWFQLLQENQDDLALLMTLEQGKPLAEARGEVQYAASFIEWFAEEGKRAYGELIPTHKPMHAFSSPVSRWEWSPPSPPGTFRRR